MANNSTFSFTSIAAIEDEGSYVKRLNCPLKDIEVQGQA